MGMNIKNPAVEAKVRRVAELHGLGLTEAIEKMADRELRRQEAQTDEYRKRLKAYLNSIREMEPVAEGYGSDHSDMYDENGLPVW